MWRFGFLRIPHRRGDVYPFRGRTGLPRVCGDPRLHRCPAESHESSEYEQAFDGGSLV